MSDPTEVTHANPHPISGHRTPREIAEDEAGPIGHPDEQVVAKHGSGQDLPSAVPAKHPRKTGTSKRRPKRAR
jgi:hypothetical protein